MDPDGIRNDRPQPTRPDIQHLPPPDESSKRIPDISKHGPRKSVWMIVFLIVGITVLPFALCGTGLGLNTYSESGGALSEPQVMTYREFIANGPGGNSHVLLTDVRLADDAMATEGIKGNRTSGVWTKVWIPLEPADGQEWDRSQTVVLESTQIVIPSDLEALKYSGRIRGIVNKTYVNSKSGEALGKHHPNANQSKCWILKHEGLVIPGRTSLTIATVCLALLAVSITLIVLAIRIRRRLNQI